MSNGLGGIFGIAASGMSATRLQMDVVAENLANADSTSGPDGKPYQRKEVSLSEAPGGGFATLLASAGGSSGGSSGSGLAGVEVNGITADPTPGQKVYDPGNPAADAQGYVQMPNVNPVSEMVDLITASRSYEANVQVLTAAKTMYSKTLDILK
jgi:flagellar basal-body rod protein FlgC